MGNSRKWVGTALGAGIASLALSGSAARAQTVAHWRMESDTDPGTAGSVVNEVVGGTPLTGATLSIATTPLPGASIVDPVGPVVRANVGAADGNADVNSVATSYAALNTSSITVEGFFRTQEGTATLVARNTGTTGFVISQPNDVTVTYYVNGAVQTLKGGTGGITGGVVDLDAP